MSGRQKGDIITQPQINFIFENSESFGIFKILLKRNIVNSQSGDSNVYA